MRSLRPLAAGARRLAALAIAALATTSAVAAYPDRPITLVVPFAAAGTTDLAARLLADLLNKATGATVVIDNKAGAGGMVGAQYAARARPDGYTLLYASDSLIIQPLVNRNVKIDLDDFIPLVRVRTTGNYLAVGAQVPARNLKELVALAKSRPGQINYATGGAGSVLHLAGESFAHSAGIKLNHIPYKGAAPATADAVGGQVEMVWAGAVDLAPFARTGQVRVLAQTSSKRSLALPNVPTMVESGYPDVVVVNWNGVMAPKGTPPEIVQWLTDKIAAVATSDEFYTRGKVLAIEPGDMLRGKAFADNLKESQARLKKVVDASNIKLSE